jgi:hypothetical protein
MTSSVLKRIEALEAAVIASRHPQLLFVHTKSLADRIGKALPAGADYQLVHMRYRDDESDEAYEAKLREDSPSEANRLDALLRGPLTARINWQPGFSGPRCPICRRPTASRCPHRPRWSLGCTQEVARTQPLYRAVAVPDLKICRGGRGSAKTSQRKKKRNRLGTLMGS